MPTYRFEVYERHTAQYDVHANSLSEAIELFHSGTKDIEMVDNSDEFIEFDDSDPLSAEEVVNNSISDIEITVENMKDIGAIRAIISIEEDDNL